MSASPLSSAASLVDGNRTMLSRGWRDLSRGILGVMQCVAIYGGALTFTVPATSMEAIRESRSMSVASVLMLSANAASARPSSVSGRLLERRSTNLRPSAFSNASSRRPTVTCSTSSSRAAAESDLVRARTVKNKDPANRTSGYFRSDTVNYSVILVLILLFYHPGENLV